jgi:hypothetical protein
MGNYCPSIFTKKKTKEIQLTPPEQHNWDDFMNRNNERRRYRYSQLEITDELENNLFSKPFEIKPIRPVMIDKGVQTDPGYFDSLYSNIAKMWK